MTAANELAPEALEAFLRAAWMSHDARWYSAAVEECGVEVANRLNRRAIRRAGAVEARRLHRALGLPAVRTAQDIGEFAEIGSKVVVGEMVQLKTNVIDDHSYEVRVTRCFAADQIARAGLASSYECGIFDRIQGWHEGLGVPLDDDVPTTTCLLANGHPCERTLKIAHTSTAG